MLEVERIVLSVKERGAYKPCAWLYTLTQFHGYASMAITCVSTARALHPSPPPSLRPRPWPPSAPNWPCPASRRSRSHHRPRRLSVRARAHRYSRCCSPCSSSARASCSSRLTSRPRSAAEQGARHRRRTRCATRCSRCTFRAPTGARRCSCLVPAGGASPRSVPATEPTEHDLCYPREILSSFG
jgi:hypothetical protein